MRDRNLKHNSLQANLRPTLAARYVVCESIYNMQGFSHTVERHAAIITQSKAVATTPQIIADNSGALPRGGGCSSYLSCCPIACRRLRTTLIQGSPPALLDHSRSWEPLASEAANKSATSASAVAASNSPMNRCASLWQLPASSRRTPRVQQKYANEA